MGTANFKRIHIIVMDSVGIGEAPDAAKFNDFDVDTFGHRAWENCRYWCCCGRKFPGENASIRYKLFSGFETMK